MRRSSDRAHQHPRPPVAANMRRLTVAGVTAEQIDDNHYRVGRYLFWPWTGYWRSDDRSVHGYGADNLIAKVRANG